MSDRYLRHGMIDWFDQAKLAATRIIVVGAGAVGNEVLKNLALLGVGHLHIIDFDRIEEHNLTKCVLFRDGDIGRTKAEAAAEACRGIDPNIKVTATCVDYWDALTLGEIAGADALLCCVDNFDARLGLNRLCRLAGTDFYNTGIDSRHAVVELYPFRTDPDCACYECNLPPSAYQAIQKRYSCGWLRKASFEERKIPTTAITSSLAGATATALLLQRLNKHPQRIEGAMRYFVDSITLGSTVSAQSPNAECPACRGDTKPESVVAAKRNCAAGATFPLADNCASEVELSEPVLLRGTCTSCGHTHEYGESVRKLTDAVTFCTTCGTASIKTEIIEHMPARDFMTTFAGRNIPVNFLTCRMHDRNIIIEMED
jgi:molybdopterin/thiamine biosynthesis adenylyltransferase